VWPGREMFSSKSSIRNDWDVTGPRSTPAFQRRSEPDLILVNSGPGTDPEGACSQEEHERERLRGLQTDLQLGEISTSSKG
jgi:hypothetical protein